MVIPQTFKASETANVAIVGGGVIGLSIARELALRGVNEIVLIERSRMGSEASYAAGGMLAPQAEADCADDFFELACQSRAMYPTLAAALREETEIDIELDTTGTLYLAFDEHEEQEIGQRYAWQIRAGLPVEKLSAVEARRVEPCISENVHAALRFPLDTQVENRRLLAALISSCEKHGIRLMSGTSVESVRLQGGRVAGVDTAIGFVSSRMVVIASGSWTSFIAASGESARRLPKVRVEPVRGQMICFRSQPPLARHVICSPRGYLVPRLDGRLLAGSTTEQAGFDASVTGAGLHSILSHALEISGVVWSFPVVESWAGLRPHCKDDLPVLGPCAVDGLFYATGHYRNGILLAPITGKLIADAIVGNVVLPLLSRFVPERFETAGAAL